MALYEITVDCRIANKDYKKGDVVSNEEVKEYFPSVMKPVTWEQKPLKKVAEAPKAAPKDEESDEEVKGEEVKDEKEEEEKSEPKKWWKKK